MDVGCSSRPPPLAWGRGSSSRPFLRRRSLALSDAAPDLGRGITPLGRSPLGMGSSWLLPLTSDVGKLLSATLSAPVAAARIHVLSIPFLTYSFLVSVSNLCPQYAHLESMLKPPLVSV